MYIVGIDIAKRKHEAAVIDGEGTVIETNVVAGTLKVRSNVEILAPRIYKRDECAYIRGGKRAPQAPDKEDE